MKLKTIKSLPMIQPSCHKELPWENRDLIGHCFDNQDLRGQCFYGMNLYGSSFKGANLEGVDLSQAVLTQCDFTGANLFSASLSMSCRGFVGVKFDPVHVAILILLGSMTATDDKIRGRLREILRLFPSTVKKDMEHYLRQEDFLSSPCEG